MTQGEDVYQDYRSWAIRTWSGSLSEAVRGEMALAFEQDGYPLMRNWWSYEGPDTAPFALYTRWHADRVVIASIEGDGTKRGRLPLICEAFEATGLEVVWENVLNAPLRYALRRYGYASATEEPCPSATLSKPPRPA